MPPRSLRTLSCLQVVDLLAEVGVALDVHLPGAAEAVEVVDVERAEVDLQRVEDLGRSTRPCVLACVAVDVQVQPGRVGPEAGEQALQARVVPSPSATTLSADVLQRPSGPGRRGPRS